MADLSTRYLGLELRNPVIASAGPLSQRLEDIRALADAGVGAVTMFSLFEEQVAREAERQIMLEESYEELFLEATSFFPNVPQATGDAVSSYLRLVEEAASSIDVPLIASLNGASHGGWTRSAKRIQDAGASAIELNIYYVPGDLTTTGQQVEQRHLDILGAVKREVSIPVTVKLSPYFSSVGAMCRHLDEAGADGLVLFNRFLQPDIDLERVEVTSGVTLSHPDDARLPRTWIAVLHEHLRASLAASSGVDQAGDVVKYILAGADVVGTTSALVRHGIPHATTLIDGLDQWLDGHQLTLAEARGMLAVPAEAHAAAYERAGYVSALEKAKTTYGSLV
ncbi:dihydroorotate dehydrogenase-like protein [Arachnia propionica]|uniref:Dihydroorotate dehydrogenase-like protein n=1 Tax=Arachnia propionica TaxID=1750 RepID=A0A3P1TAP0_9ACTN|nr:dihydroorotate dehydrogenase-like protein [Arachnia propionica]MDO5083683.1 dihydroorotate dehydrogenase-like protein [Arachnia propionica]RRD06265.1 dihydroorotate dehydrogenase-like protein [Arachnia propionica]